MLLSELKKGAKVILTGNREATIRDNKRGGIRRMVEIRATNGWFNDMGDVYVDEFLYVKTDAGLERIELTDRQEKQIAKVRSELKALGF